MKRPYTIASWIIELVILPVLLWKHLDLYDLGWYDLDATGLLLLISPLVVIAHWMLLRKKHIAKKVRLKLLFLTGPSVFLCMSLVLGLTYELRKVAIAGGVPKRIAGEIDRNKEKLPIGKGDSCEMRVLSEKLSRYDVAYYLGVERMKSEILIYAMLLATSCILYGNRYSLGRLEYSEGPPMVQG